jgi:ketosteroid isomerase-like protein
MTTPTLQTLLDKEAIRELVLDYSRGIDRRDYALVRSLYWDDAIDDHGAMFCGSPDEYVAWLRRALGTFEATTHAVLNSHVRLDGNAAEGEHYMIAYHRTPGPGRREIVLGGRYLDQYQRRDGQWKFWRRALALDWADDRPVCEAAWQSFAAGADHGRAGADDPSYRALALFRRYGMRAESSPQPD